MKPHFRYATRLNSMKARPDLYTWKSGRVDLRGMLERMDLVKGLDGLYINYPEHFVGDNKAMISDWLAGSKLQFFGLNIRFPDQEFGDGGLTHPDSAQRIRAIDLCKRAVDDCRALGGDEVVIWPAQDGCDYPMQTDHEILWQHTLEGLAAVAEYGADLKISVEMKPAEPRRRSLLDSTATTLLAVNSLGHGNLGLTLDYCHMLMAHENPSMSAVHCLRQGKLFGMHMNDGHGSLDDGLAIGTVTPAETLELIHYLRQFAFGGVIYFDTFPVREDPVWECELNIAQMEGFSRHLDRVDQARLQILRSQHDAIGVINLLNEAKP